MYVRNSLGGRNIINKEKSEVETNTNLPPQGEKLENNVPSVENPVAEVNNEHRHQEGEKSDPAKKKQIRCKKWPQCKTTNCEFAHPTGTCPYFPKCVFNEKCLYIHPNIPCKFGYYCTRVGCSYSHPTGYNPGMYNNMMGGMQPQMAWGPPKFKNLTMDYNKKEANDKIKLAKPESVEPMPTQEVIAEINQI